jgi:dTMP kinase
MNVAEPLIIAIAGCDGAGKSTQVKLLYDNLNKWGYDTFIVDKWDVLDSDTIPESRFINTSLDELKKCMVSMPGISRALMLFWTLAITLESKIRLTNRYKVLLLDGYWMKHAAAEIIFGCDLSWVLSTVAQLPAPHLTLYLDISSEDAAERKNSFNLMECGLRATQSREDFLSHQNLLRHQLTKWSDDFGWIKLDATRSRDELFASIADIVISNLHSD